MKSMLHIAAGVALLVSIAACSTAQQASATADLAKLQATVVQGCQVIQPTLQSIAALDPSVGAVATANGLFCAGASTISVTSVQSMLATGIPAVDAAINASTFIPANQKPLLIAAIGIGQLTIQNALTAFGTVTATAPAASAPAASAPK